MVAHDLADTERVHRHIAPPHGLQYFPQAFRGPRSASLSFCMVRFRNIHVGIFEKFSDEPRDVKRTLTPVEKFAENTTGIPRVASCSAARSLSEWPVVPMTSAFRCAAAIFASASEAVCVVKLTTTSAEAMMSLRSSPEPTVPTIASEGSFSRTRQGVYPYGLPRRR